MVLFRINLPGKGLTQEISGGMDGPSHGLLLSIICLYQFCFLTCSHDLTAEEYCSTMAKGNSAHGFCQSNQWPESLSWFPYAGFGSQSINDFACQLIFSIY